MTTLIRVWNERENKMYYEVGAVGSLLIFEYEQAGYDFYELDLKYYDHSDEEYKVMHYTGVNDMNEAKVFCGDYVNVYSQDGEEKLISGGLIEWKQEWCGFYIDGKRRLESDMKLELAGNKYELEEAQG